MAEIVTTKDSYPNRIEQCVKLNGELFSSWSRLDKVKRDEWLDKSSPYDLCAVAYNISSSRKSGIVYAFDFGFSVPDDAVITEVKCTYKVCADDNISDVVQTNLLKLKVGASVSDEGVGKYPVENVDWITHRNANRNGMQKEEVSNGEKSVSEFWGVELTGALVNSKDFGFLIQCVGTGKSKHKVYLDNMRVQLSYKLPDESTHVNTSKTSYVEKYHIGTSISAVKYETLTPDKYIEQSTIQQPFDSSLAFNFWLRYRNFAVTKNDNKVILKQRSYPFILETDGKTKFSGGSTVLKVPSLSIMGTSDSKYIKSSQYPLAPEYLDYFYPVHVYSNILSFDDSKSFVESTVKLYSADTTNGVLKKKTELDNITFKLTNNVSNNSDSKCVLENCVFVQNKAGVGSAIYNDGRMYVDYLKFEGNESKLQASSCAFHDFEICREYEYDS